MNLGYKVQPIVPALPRRRQPHRTEMMDGETVELLLDTLKHVGAKALDLTGGAPELNPYFRALVTEARAWHPVIDRCNLTVLFEPGPETTARFLADHGVAITASLPLLLGRQRRQATRRRCL